jgi:anti-sigma factor RsiW
MSDRDHPVSEEELHAYVDAQLFDDRRAAVEAWLATHPDDMSKIAAWRAQGDALRARYGAVTEEPVPARLTLAQIERGGRSWRRYATAAALAAFIVGGIGGWIARGAVAAPPNKLETLVSDAIHAYKIYVVEVRHPVEVPGSEEAHLVQWLSKRVGHEVRAPDLQSIGLRLVGGRLLPGPTGAAAFFMYENTAGERFTIYCARASSPAMALRYNAADNVSAMTWVDDKVAYVISGEANRDRLHEVAQTAYEQMETRPPQKTGG